MGSEISAEELKEEEQEVKEEPPKESKDSRHKAVFLTPEEAAEPSKVGWLKIFPNSDIPPNTRLADGSCSSPRFHPD